MVGSSAQQNDLRHDLGVWLRALYADNIVRVDESALAKHYLDALMAIEYDRASYRGTPYRVSHAQRSTIFMRCEKGDLGFSKMAAKLGAKSQKNCALMVGQL